MRNFESTLLAVLAILFGHANVASSASFTFTGNLTHHNDVVRIGFTVANESTDVRIWTDSFMDIGSEEQPRGTNFDPVTALWFAETGELIEENDDNADIAPDQTAHDSGFSIGFLGAGNYMLTLATYENFTLTNNISDGFTYDNEEPILISDWDQPENLGNLRGTFWRLHFEGVDSVTPASVPLPSAVWLFGSALLGLLGIVKETEKKDIWYRLNLRLMLLAKF